jgi:hypothetical protein
MNFLFRRPPGGHIFMTTQDPTYIYKVLCGHCDYPIEEDDAQCPRCQLELEDCPVCREETHKKARKLPRDPLTGAVECPVCHTRRVPFGGEPILEVEGSFCRNIYGCRAGGLLLRNEELAVLRQNASRCPICKHEELTPLDVKVFLYLVSRCLFCNSVFGPLHTWQPKWSKDWEASLKSLSEVGVGDPASCILCGRRDKFHAKGKNLESKAEVAAEGRDRFQVKTEDSEDMVEVAVGGDADEFKTRKIPALHYLRVVELGRVLILEKDPAQAFQRLFGSWFEPNRMLAPDATIPVGDVSSILLEGTLIRPIQRILRGRVDEMLKAWGERLPSGGLTYPVAARDSRKGTRS